MLLMTKYSYEVSFLDIITRVPYIAEQVLDILASDELTVESKNMY